MGRNNILWPIYVFFPGPQAYNRAFSNFILSPHFQRVTFPRRLSLSLSLSLRRGSPTPSHPVEAKTLRTLQGKAVPMVLATTENGGSGNTYEEARKQRLLENKKKIEDLGIMKISKSLTDVTKSEKPRKTRQVRQKQTNTFLIEPRRSSRARKEVTSYYEDVGVELPTLRNRSRPNSSGASYLARPVEEVKVASYEERARAFNSAEKLRSNLETGNPSFVKSMVRSHVYSCFWLGLPTSFCRDHLPKSTTDMVLENEEGSEYESVYIGQKTGLSGGWRAFALDHKLDDGDALVFELIEPTRFKVYIVRAFDCQDKTDSAATSDAEDKPKKKRDSVDAEEKSKKKRKKKDDKQTEKPAEVSGTRRSLRNKNCENL